MDEIFFQQTFDSPSTHILRWCFSTILLPSLSLSLSLSMQWVAKGAGRKHRRRDVCRCSVNLQKVSSGEDRWWPEVTRNHDEVTPLRPASTSGSSGSLAGTTCFSIPAASVLIGDAYRRTQTVRKHFDFLTTAYLLRSFALRGALFLSLGLVKYICGMLKDNFYINLKNNRFSKSANGLQAR